MGMKVEIDYIPDGAVEISRTRSNQVRFELPDTTLYLTPATAEAVRDALVDLLGVPDGHWTSDLAAETARDLLVPDGDEAYQQGYRDALEAAAETLE